MNELGSHARPQTPITPRVSLCGPENAAGEIARTLEILSKFQRRLVNSTRATANSPFLARMFFPLMLTLTREGLGTVLSTRIKELAIIKTSHLNGCHY